MNAKCTDWQPTRFERWEQCNDGCSTGVARILTDAGAAYLKALGNAEGPHALAREWVGTSLARWFGLVTFDFAQIILEDDCDIPLGKGRNAQPGPAFVTRSEGGMPWSSAAEELMQLVNPGDLTKLVMLDSWLLNNDRYPPTQFERKPNYDNVFLSTEGLTKKKRRLVAMDFSDCLKSEVSLTPRIANISNVKDENLLGLFPEFKIHLSRQAFDQGLASLGKVSNQEMLPIVEGLPDEWEINRALRDALMRFLVQRAAFLLEHLPKTLGLYVPEQLDFKS